MTQARRIGLFQIAASGVSFGALGVFGKLAFQSGLSVGELLSYRFVIATLMMAFGFSVFSPKKFSISKRDLLICSLLGLSGYAVFSTFYFLAIQGVSVATASLLLYTYPIFVAIGARVFFRERLTKAQLAALPVALVGLAILLSGDVTSLISSVRTQDSPRLFAIGCGLAAAVCYSAYILLSSRYQKSIDPMTSGFYVMLFAALGLFLFHQPPHLARRKPLADSRDDHLRSRSHQHSFAHDLILEWPSKTRQYRSVAALNH